MKKQPKILWTIQTLSAWEQLQNNGILVCDSSYIDPDFMRAYQWLVQQMKSKIKAPKYSCDFPIWAWFRWQEKKPRPDLRSRGHLPSGESGVRIEFAIDEDKVLLSDFELWHYVLNYWYLPNSLADIDIFESNSKSLSRTEYDEKIVASWQRIFDLSWYKKDISDCFAKKSIQGTLWELSKESICDVTFFKAR